MWALQQVGFGRRQVAVATNRVEVLGHQCEWFAVAVLAGTQPLDGLWIGRITSQVKAAQPANGHHRPAIEQSITACKFPVANKSAAVAGSTASSQIDGPQSGHAIGCA